MHSKVSGQCHVECCRITTTSSLNYMKREVKIYLANARENSILALTNTYRNNLCHKLEYGF